MFRFCVAHEGDSVPLMCMCVCTCKFRHICLIYNVWIYMGSLVSKCFIVEYGFFIQVLIK